MRLNRIELRRQDGRLLDLSLRLDEVSAGLPARLIGCDYRQLPARLAAASAPGTVAAALAACRAVETALGIEPDPASQQLRRLLLCGEWLRTHTRHIYNWHAVRLLGYPSLRVMAQDYPEVAARACRLNRLAARLLQLVGGRCGRVATLAIGGFNRVPDPAVLQPMVAELEWAQAAARDTVNLVSRLPFPRWNRDCDLMALTGAHYIDLGEQVAVTGGASRPLAQAVAELEGATPPLYTGPLARFAVSGERLPPAARQLAQGAGLAGEIRSPFKCLILRAVELAAAVEEALEILRGYRPPAVAAEPPARAGEGVGGAESAHGLWLQRYRLDARGRVEQALVRSPLSLSRSALERDLRNYLALRSSLEGNWLLLECRQLLGSFDAGLAARIELLEPQAAVR